MESKKSRNKKHLKICFACSAGGHLKQAATVINSINYEKYLVTYDAPHIKKTIENIRTYFITHPKRNPFLVIRNAFESFRLLLKEKPQVIISTGADVAVPTCILGKLMGARLIYIESGAQICTPSLSGRIVYPFADLFIVQWIPALQNFPKAIYGGPLF